jgi:hypothetical protein
MSKDLSIMSEAKLRAEVERLRTEVDRVDDWANGIFALLVEVLPHLLRDHPNVEKIQRSLQAADERYEDLLAHPEHAEAGESAGLYEARKMLHRQLALLGVWPDVDPAAAAERSLARARQQRDE